MKTASYDISLEDVRRTYRDRRAGFINQKKFFAVLLPLVEVDGTLHLLFETRAKGLDAQPGEICFPGGAMEEGESPLACALRETCEEIGVQKKDIDILGEGDVLTHSPGFAIYTYVGLLKSISCKKDCSSGSAAKDFPARWRGVEGAALTGLCLGADEVEDVFTIPLAYFLEHAPREEMIGLKEDVPEDFPYALIGQDETYPWHRSRYSVLIYDYPGRYLWGMTAKMAHHFARTLQEEK